MSPCRGFQAGVATTHRKLSRFRRRARMKVWHLLFDNDPGFPATTRGAFLGGPYTLEGTRPALRFRGCAEIRRNQSSGLRPACPVIFRLPLLPYAFCLSLLVPGRAERREDDQAGSCRP